MRNRGLGGFFESGAKHKAPSVSWVSRRYGQARTSQMRELELAVAGLPAVLVDPAEESFVDPQLLKACVDSPPSFLSSVPLEEFYQLLFATDTEIGDHDSQQTRDDTSSFVKATQPVEVILEPVPSGRSRIRITDYTTHQGSNVLFRDFTRPCHL
jgi:hypothetical protein